MTRNEFKRYNPVRFFGEGTAAVPAPVRASKRRSRVSTSGTANKTMADRGERVAFLHTDSSERWMVHGFTSEREHPCMNVVWDDNGPNSSKPDLGSTQDLDLVDWDLVSFQREDLDPHRRTNPLIKRTYPTLDTLTARHEGLASSEREVHPPS